MGKIVNYVSAPCGAGKTHAICDYIAKNITEKFMVVLPTIDLSNDYAKNLKDRKVPFVSCINGSNVSKKIEEAIIDVKQRGKMARESGKTALKTVHPDMCHDPVFCRRNLGCYLWILLPKSEDVIL